MRKPIVGVIGNALHLEERFHVQMAGQNNFSALADVANALPMMFASHLEITDIGALLDAVDGILLTGARANVHPAQYSTPAHPDYEPYDEKRDAIALALSRACVEAGVPLLGICRGFQEMNVAFGGTLHPEIRDLPGRINHRMPRLPSGEIHPDLSHVFSDRHDVQLTSDGYFAQLYQRDTIRVNSLHGQGILDTGERVIVEGVAEDSTVEAIRIDKAPGFAVGVQWHAEYDPQTNPINKLLFEDYGKALQEAVTKPS